MANNETRILKNNSVEELRQKTNEVSFSVGDKKLLDSRLTDKIYSYTASAGDTIFEDARIEHKPEETVDNTSGYIILTGSPTIPSGFIAGASLTQSGGYSATIVSASSDKILVKNSSGTLNTGSNLIVGSDTLAHANVVRLVAESYPRGELIVTNGGTELVQDATSTNGFHLPNYVLKVILTGSPTIPASFTEGATLTQSGGFSGVLLSATSTVLRFKNFSGSFSNSSNLGAPHTDAANRIQAANISSNIQKDNSFGTAIELNTPASASDAIVIKTTNLVDAVTEIQDDVGEITTLNTNNKADIVSSINELEVGIRGTSNVLVDTILTTVADDLAAAINEHDTELGNIALIDDASGYSATTVSGGITELQSHVGTKASLTTGAKTNLVAAINEVDANADASFKLTSGSLQTINSNATYTTGKTFTFPSGSTLDIRQGSLLTGSGGGELTFDTAFLTLTVNDSSNTEVNQFGLEGRRAGSGTDVRLQWNETLVGSKPDRAWQVQGLATDGTTSTTADIVTFYNAQDLIANNTESGIAVTWDSTNQNFDFNVADPTLTYTSTSLKGGASLGSGTLTNLGNLTVNLEADRLDLADGQMVLLGTHDDLLIYHNATDSYIDEVGTGNLLLRSNGLGVKLVVQQGGTYYDAVQATALGVDLRYQGNAKLVTNAGGVLVTGELESTTLDVNGSADIAGALVVHGNTTLGDASSDTVSIPGDLTVTGNFTVNGTNTVLSTTNLEVEDTLILMGNSNTAPTTGGFGLETRQFTGVGTHSNAASNVTGSHSIVYNFHPSKDRWEMDGSPLLSEATQANPAIHVNNSNLGDLTGSRTLEIGGSSGITVSAALNSSTFNFEITNADRGSSQNIYKNIQTQNANGSLIAQNTANINNDTLIFREIQVGGIQGIELTNVTGDIIGIQHADTSSQASIDNTSNTVIQDVTLDTYGHVTGLASKTISLSSLGYTGSTTADNYGSFTINANSGTANTIGSGETFGIFGGGGIDTSVSTNSITISHSNTSSIGNINTSGAQVIDTMNFDTYGHATSYATRNLTLSDLGYSGSTSADNYNYWTMMDGIGNTYNITSTDTFRLLEGSGITVRAHSDDHFIITNSAQNVTTNIGISRNSTQVFVNSSDGTDGTINEATASYAGVMTAAHHEKLDGIATGATANVGDITGVTASTGLSGGGTSGAVTLSVNSDQRSSIRYIGYSTSDYINFGNQNSMGIYFDGLKDFDFIDGGTLHANNNVIAYSTSISSDEKLKENIQVVDGALEIVSQLNGVTFDWKRDGKQSAGVIAQDVEKVFPRAVEEVKGLDSEDTYKTVDYNQIIGLLVESVKELKEEIEELKKHK